MLPGGSRAGVRLGDKLGEAAMTPSRWQQIEELYHAALECEPGERTALLARAEPELRREVESLLAQQSGATPLDHPAWEGAANLLGSTVADKLGRVAINPERMQQVYELYHAARECGPGERAALLARADPELRRKVELLLTQDPSKSSALDRPAWAGAAGLTDSTVVLITPGTQLGPYQIEGPIAAGGMGEVFRGVDTRLGRPVAVKTSREQFSARFDREARAIASLNHPNICTLYDVGPNYLVMELCEGETLAARLKRGKLSIEDTLRSGQQIAGALAAAHAKGIVHRDLKPSNIMLAKSGVKVLDFGLAKSQQDATLTGSRMVMGTPAYMAPEQSEGKECDARSDIFSFGLVLYEMLTGERVFRSPSTIETIAAGGRKDRKPLREFVKDVPDELERIIRRCLRKHPEERYASMSEIERELEDCRALASEHVSGVNLKVLFRQIKHPRVAIPGLLILLALGSLSAWWLQRSSGAGWARTQALPQIAQLIEHEKVGEAYALAIQAERYISDDPTLGKFWPAISWPATIRTVPPGASVFRRDYNAPNGAWELVGRSPIEKRRMPLVNSQWRFELKGYAAAERSTVVSMRDVLSVSMDEEAEAPTGMVHQTHAFGVTGIGPLQGTPATLSGLPGFEDLPAIPLEAYWIDRYEVTNRQFKQFLDQGGYRKQEYWKQEFRKDGHLLSWAEAMALFRDTTGRPGPATWVQGEYPRGQEDFPVTGVSWYEAAAYAEFAGKSLPTIYHWITSASPWASFAIIPASNFGGQGPASVGTHSGMSWSGTYDMAGNVKEWCLNKGNSGRRYIMGGAWDEPTYLFNDADARSPFERSANFGFRCARYVSTGGAARAADPVTLQARDFSRETPVSDSLFRVYKSLYSYDKTPLHAVVESPVQTDDWKKEEITFAAAYGNERIIAYLFLPKKSQPPFQTVVYFPGAAAIDLRSSANQPELRSIDFVLKSGRAVMVPVFKGTYERGDDLKSDYPNTSSSWRDHVIAWSKDLGRSIDYLETRPEIDRSKLAYEGVSWGAAMGSVLPAVEDRIKVCVLIVPGFYLQRSLPEVDELNFAPRVKVPVLMLNGRFDFDFPVETSQEPMFRLLGTPIEQKRRVVYATGHNIPRNELIKETLDWLDRYLGPVK